jgi:hypothetical protein
MERRSDESDEIAAIRAFLRQGGLKVWLTLSVVIALILYTMWPPRGSAAQTIPPSMAYFVTWLNQHNPVYIVLLVLCVYAVLFGAMIYMAHRKLRLFDLRKDHPFYWAKVLFLFVTFIVLWSGFTFYRTSSDYSTLYAVYPTYGATVAKVAAVLVLTNIGIGLYLFKQYSKLLYGLSEIALAVASNLALLNRIDFSHAPKIILSSTDAIGIAAFTYLLSRGVTNFVEGFDERRSRSA